ncbi:sigma-54-dependent Fis family transcriptional regulator [Pseudonocardia halophobica]|uniref:sigma-54-dependent Fis family transcriptional regulator n=1 Tax=Pseudonocardia halophobica TaxID=29401 RepID=UPI003D8E5688
MPDRRLLLASARADLLDGNGALECHGVPDHVAASWRRSVSHGVPPDGVQSPYFAELDFGSRLVRCAQPVIDQLSEQIADVPMCVALTDSRARIVVRRDSSQWIGKILDRVYFAKGFGYDEGAVGTNGVGTVLEFGESVHIVGAEHFVDNLQSFACAGAPVRDPFSGRIEGVLDISCLSDHSTPIMHSLVRSAAQRIEHNLLLDRNEAQQALFDVYSRVDSRTRDAVVAVGPRFVLANTALQTLLVSTDQEALHDHIRFVTRRHSTVDDKVDLPSGLQIRLRGSTVTVGDDVAGMIGIVTPLRDDIRSISRERFTTAAASKPVAAEPSRQVASSSPAWRAAETIACSALGADETVLVLGEPGSGRFTLLAQLVRLERPGVRLHRIEAQDVEKDPCEIGCVLAEADPQEDLYILCDVDQLCGRTADAMMACLGEHSSAPGLLGATAGVSARPDTDQGALLALFCQSATLPPLRHRTGDLMALVRSILHELAPYRELQVSPEAFRVLGRYRWPGNVRELREVLAGTVARRPVGVIQAEDLPAYCQSAPRSPLRQVDQIERDAIIDAIRQAKGNRKAAAAALGFSRSTLYRKIQQYGITD